MCSTFAVRVELAHVLRGFILRFFGTVRWRDVLVCGWVPSPLNRENRARVKQKGNRQLNHTKNSMGAENNRISKQITQS